MIKVKLYKTHYEETIFTSYGWVGILMKSTSTTLLDGDPERVHKVYTDEKLQPFSCLLSWRGQNDIHHVDGILEGVEDAALCWIRVILSSILLCTMSCSNLLAVSAALSAPSTRAAMS